MTQEPNPNAGTGAGAEETSSWTGEPAGTADSTAGKFSGHGVHVSTMDNGDKIYVKFQGGGSMKPR